MNHLFCPSITLLKHFQIECVPKLLQRGNYLFIYFSVSMQFLYLCVFLNIPVAQNELLSDNTHIGLYCRKLLLVISIVEIEPRRAPWDTSVTPSSAPPPRPLRTIYVASSLLQYENKGHTQQFWSRFEKPVLQPAW